MAEPTEDIIIIEESDAAELSEQSDSVLQDKSQKQAPVSKKMLLIFGIAFFFILLIIVLSVFLFSEDPQPIQKLDKIEEKLEEQPKTTIEPTKLENMIAKANYLYSSGSKAEALQLYEQIAHYSEAISLYNLGVAQLKEKQYQSAFDTFRRAIKNNEKVCVSALNASVCALHLGDDKSFRYYIDLAYAFLPHELQSPLYSYYYALINYYKENYYETLIALNNPTSQEYERTHNVLLSKINAMYGNNYGAIEALEKVQKSSDALSLGLLYARVGDLTLSKKYLEDAIMHNIEPIKAQIALGLIQLKSGQIQAAAKQIENATDMFGEEVYKHYPIKVKLKESLFDPKKAQKRYRDLTNNSPSIRYQKLFYFSPYKVFNANQTISYIRKGNANIFIDNIDSAKDYLQRSVSASGVNKGIAVAIQEALRFHLRKANKILQDLAKQQPKHSILHYNLALTYAQLGNMKDAHEHFLRSYHLDAKNYLSGVYAVMTSQLVSQENDKMKSFLKDALALEEDSEEIILYKTLLNIAEKNYFATTDWLNRDYKQRPLYLVMDLLIAEYLNDASKTLEATSQLSNLLPNDILPQLMYANSKFSDLSEQKYAYETIHYMQSQDFSFEDLYFGPQITRYLYTQYALITGQLYPLITQLKEKLATTSDETHEMIDALALANLYHQEFEESYTLYNQLIDTLKVQDARTLFLGAVASTAAEHHGNAIALLELAKLKDSQFLESRYALGLLYLQVKNNKGAAIQFARVHKEGFNSEYFNFDIDLDLLLFLKQQQDSK